MSTGQSAATLCGWGVKAGMDSNDINPLVNFVLDDELCTFENASKYPQSPVQF